MRDQQSNPTTEMQQSTVNQAQTAFEQLFELQRNAAKMTLSMLEWQETAQKQGLQLSKTLVQNYVQGVEAMMPDMEHAMEQGMEAATTAGQTGGGGMRGFAQQGQQGFGSQGLEHQTSQGFGQQQQQPSGRRPQQYGSPQQPQQGESYGETGQWIQQSQPSQRPGQERVQSGGGGYERRSQGVESPRSGSQYQQRDDRPTPPYETPRQGSSGRRETPMRQEGSMGHEGSTHQEGSTDRRGQSRGGPAEREQHGDTRRSADTPTSEQIEDDAGGHAKNADTDREERKETENESADRSKEEQESQQD